MLTKEFPEVLGEGLGKYTGNPISFNLDSQVPPWHLKPHRMPFTLKPKVDTEIDKLLAQGILEPIDNARWETPIVTPIKSDGSVCICTDFKCTLNRALQQCAYPVPMVQHLLHSLGQGTIFAKLHLTQAYQQLPVAEATAEAQTIVTHKSAFKCHRLQFGVSLAPGLFRPLFRQRPGISKVPSRPTVPPPYHTLLVKRRRLEVKDNQMPDRGASGRISGIFSRRKGNPSYP
ncbi:PREDICTED: uncharacterized protein K02A2.6-like [Thamnophis sirtalis]|uniref:Uncharacterized protein K02A2.6-like n=1 Tax=Thamnophis sirtalis TaxID=35019 RepID=A0A6I9X7A7_9SAUR|nr:PREDICTED: uncharacterized protein K02A2.6-like [Thamnophis sirtalis]